MQFIESLYIDGRLKDLGTIVYALKREIPVFAVYCICMRHGGPYQLEILSAGELLQTRNKEREYIIAGLAKDLKGALDLVAYIVEDTVKKGGNVSELRDTLMGE